MTIKERKEVLHRINNVQEEINTVVSAASYLTEDYVTEKILTILGDGDKANKILKQKAADELERGRVLDREEDEEKEEENLTENNKLTE